MGMKQLSTERRVQVVAALVEGNSIASTVRMTGVSKPTVLKLLVDLGTACQKYHDEHVRGLTCKRIQCDEIWAFVLAKQKNLPEGLKSTFGYGDVWTWTAIDADSKLMVSWLVGERSIPYAKVFMNDVADRLTHRIQLTTDGLRSYLDAVYDAFGSDIDYAMLIKVYGTEKGEAGRYSPPVVKSVSRDVHCGTPVREHINTSYVERSNLTMRMSMRRYTRLTNGFSKKLENHEHMNALFFMNYNFCRVHMTVKETPAMAAGLTDHRWSIEELIELM